MSAAKATGPTPATLIRCARSGCGDEAFMHHFKQRGHRDGDASRGKCARDGCRCTAYQLPATR